MPRSKEAALRRKKKGRFTKKECPFPIPMASVAGEPVGSWFYFTGFIEGSTVVVRHSGDMDFLHRMGFFGKGTLSRSQPNFNERRQKISIELPQKSGDYKLVQAVVVSKRSYLAHKRFKALADGKMKEFNDIVYQEEQQQGFVDSSDEEEEEADEEEEEDEDEEEEEEKMDEDSSDDDSVSSGGVDSVKMTAFKLLNQENSHTAFDLTNAGTSGNSVGVADISPQVRSHIISMLAKISTLSNEQITTFLQVPQEMKHLAERYKKMRKAEVNMLQQAFAAKFPGRNFKKGEVITLDEDDSVSENKRCGNESENAVVISDSDDGDGGGKSDDDDDKLKRLGFDGADSMLGQGNRKALNKSKDLSKVDSSKKDLDDWSSDDSNFWSDDPKFPVKDTSDNQQTAAEKSILKDKASENVEDKKKKSVGASSDGEQIVSADTDQVMIETELQSVSSKLVEDADQVMIETELQSVSSKLVEDADQVMIETELQCVSSKLVEDDGDEVNKQQIAAKNKAECNTIVEESESPESKSPWKTNQDVNGGEVDDAQKLAETTSKSTAGKFKNTDGVEVDAQDTDAKNVADYNIIDKKSPGEENHQDVNTDEADSVTDKKDKQPKSPPPGIEDNASSLPDIANTNDSAPNTDSFHDVSSDLKMKDDIELDNKKDSITTQSKGLEENLVDSLMSVNGDTDVILPKDSLNIQQENSLRSCDFAAKVVSSKAGEDSTASEANSDKRASENEDSEETIGQSQESVVGKASSAVNETQETVKLDKENQSEIVDSLLGIGSIEDCARDLQGSDGHLDREGHEQSEVVDSLLGIGSIEDCARDLQGSDGHLDREGHEQSEKSKTGSLGGLQIETATTNSESHVRDKFVVLSDSVENVTSIESENSNDSDDVICIESKSAEPKKLHHFLSQPVKKISIPVVTRSVTFMSSITEEPTFVCASVGFQSWGPLLHFNFTGDPSHLPTVMAVSSASSPSAGQRAPPNGQTQNTDIVYERIYPPVRSLVPNGNSTGAVIKQRLRGLPLLNVAYSQILQANDAGSGVESCSQKNLKELMVKPPQSTVQPYTRTLVTQQFSVLSTSKVTQSHLLDSHESSHRVSSDIPKIKFSQVSSYIEAYQSLSTSPASDHTEPQDGTEDAVNITSLLASLSSAIVKVSKLYSVLSSKDTLDISVDDQVKHRTETDTVLAEFHSALSRYLSCVQISSALEPHILTLLLSGQDNSLEGISNKEIVELKSKLSSFHKWLLDRRSEYLKKDQQVKNHHDLRKVVVVDLTSNSDDKIHLSQPKSGVEGSVVVDLTKKSDMKLDDSSDSSKFEKGTASNLIVDPVKITNSFTENSAIENAGVLDSDSSKQQSEGKIETDASDSSKQQSEGKIETDASDSSKQQSEGKFETDASDSSKQQSEGKIETDVSDSSKQQSEGKIETDAVHLTNSENKNESLNEENVTRDLNERQISATLFEECKTESFGKENGCENLHENTELLCDGNVCKSSPGKNIEKLNYGHVCDNASEVNISENIMEENVCTSLIKTNISKSEEAIHNEVVSEETLKHRQKTLETESRKRTFERSYDETSEMNGKKLKSDEDRLLGLDEADEKTCTSSRGEDNMMDTEDGTLVGSDECIEVESKSLMKTTNNCFKAETSLDILGQESHLLDESDVKVGASQTFDSGQPCLDSGGLPGKIINTNKEIQASETDQILTSESAEAKEGTGVVTDGVSDSCVSDVKLTTPSEVEPVKLESSNGSDVHTPCQQDPSRDSTDVEIKKDDRLMEQPESSVLNEEDSSVVTLDDSVEKMDTSVAAEAKQDIDPETAERLPCTNSPVTDLKSEKPPGKSEVLLSKSGREQPTNVVNCVVSSESDSEDVACISAVEKARPPGASKNTNPLLKKISEKKEAPKTSEKGNLQSSSTSKDIHIFIGSSSDEAEEPPAKRHRSGQSSALETHPYSTRDDPDGNLFVVANTSDEDYEDCSDDDDGEEGRVRKRRQQRWRSCVKKDPYPTQEKLHLMLEEAFFLSFGLGCLRILDPEMKLLDLTQMWQQFQVLKEHFIPHYVAYHYFRSKGWVPKSGLKFGCDLVLYREGPPFYHGSYSVVVIAVKDSTLLPVSTRGGLLLDNRKLNWVSLAGLNRITEHVAKELMLCYVIWPANMTSEESLSPDCISRFKVKELVVSRWVSSQERENKFGEEEMP